MFSVHRNTVKSDSDFHAAMAHTYFGRVATLSEAKALIVHELRSEATGLMRDYPEGGKSYDPSWGSWARDRAHLMFELADHIENGGLDAVWTDDDLFNFVDVDGLRFSYNQA